jgi:hypothetical protein
VKNFYDSQRSEHGLPTMLAGPNDKTNKRPRMNRTQITVPDPSFGSNQHLFSRPQGRLVAGSLYAEQSLQRTFTTVASQNTPPATTPGLPSMYNGTTSALGRQTVLTRSTSADLANLTISHETIQGIYGNTGGEHREKVTNQDEQ